MTVAQRLPNTMTKAEFLAALPPAKEDRRCELIDGRPVAMVGARLGHARIVTNLALSLGRPVRQRGCDLVISETFVASEERDDMLVAPDLFVCCNAVADEVRFVTNPCLVIEVLSPSTAIHDRGSKLHFYQALPSVTQILLVYTDECRVESWVRRAEPDEDGLAWDIRVAARGSTVALPDFAIDLPIAAVYENTSLAS